MAEVLADLRYPSILEQDRESAGRASDSSNPIFKIMNTNPLKQGSLTENSAGIGTVTRKMVRERAAELAAIDGRPPQEASKSDWDEAKRELTDEPESDANEIALESAPESERWDPVAGSTGHKTLVTANDDEDDEGRSDSERLVEEGVAEAEHDQKLQAAKAHSQEDQ